METSPAPLMFLGVGYKSGGGREQLKERKDGSPAGRNSIGKGVEVGGKTMGRGGLRTEGAGRGGGHTSPWPMAGQPWTWADCPIGTEREQTHHQARRPSRALDAFEANVSRRALQEAEEGCLCPVATGRGPRSSLTPRVWPTFGLPVKRGLAGEAPGTVTNVHNYLAGTSVQALCYVVCLWCYLLQQSSTELMPIL